ncbi:MAG: hypothetical protein LW832_05390, partial [Parachlamydia sp.]|nr:hypothetical protein [Parachlamydia sp.]
MEVNQNSLTYLDNFSFTVPLTYQLHCLSNSSYAITGPLAARVAGVVLIPFAALLDFFSHAGLTCLTAATGCFVSPFNFFAHASCPGRAFDKSYELSSSLIHFMHVIESIFMAALLPGLCLLNPTKAYAWSHSRFHQNEGRNTIQPDPSLARLAELTRQLEDSQQKLNSKKNKNRLLKNRLESANRGEEVPQVSPI